MYLAHRDLRAYKGKPRKFTGKCDRCNRPICAEHAYQYTDDSNAAINSSSPYLCINCYKLVHPEDVSKWGKMISVRKLNDRLTDWYMQKPEWQDALKAVITLVSDLGK